MFHQKEVEAKTEPRERKGNIKYNQGSGWTEEWLTLNKNTHWQQHLLWSNPETINLSDGLKIYISMFIEHRNYIYGSVGIFSSSARNHHFVFKVAAVQQKQPLVGISDENKTNLVIMLRAVQTPDLLSGSWRPKAGESLMSKLLCHSSDSHCSLGTDSVLLTYSPCHQHQHHRHKSTL